MPAQHGPPAVNEEDAFHFIVQLLRQNLTPEMGCRYGYNLYLPNIVRHYLTSVAQMDSARADRHAKDVSPPFLNAAWELSRRGILRPGIEALGLQVTEVGSAGSGFSVTETGKRWLKEAGQYDYVPIEPGRFSRILDSFTPKLGPGFQDRAQEAIRCYGAMAYLACCAMCGAAAESILLALAAAKKADAEAVERLYMTAGGRKRVEDLLVGQQTKQLQEEFRGYLSLLKYWRDAAAHGRHAGIGDSEAYTALAMLLRFAQFANDRWIELTAACSSQTT